MKETAYAMCRREHLFGVRNIRHRTGRNSINLVESMGQFQQTFKADMNWYK